MLSILATEKANKVFMPGNEHHQIVSLETLTAAHIDDFMDWATDGQVTQHLMWNSYVNRAEAEDFFEKVVKNHLWFKAIRLNDKVIGSITLDKGKGDRSCKAELGYVIARKYWGKGFATQAIGLAAQTGFQDLHIERIEAYVDPENIASQRTLEKNGFRKEGLLERCILQKGILKSRFLFSLLK